ncbi:MAG TPA: hypothetical protein VHU92_02755 [Streptosporangiaceae bacterium]|nr:hypothetical protein [Streptosporangiaceae bacterium]
MTAEGGPGSRLAKGAAGVITRRRGGAPQPSGKPESSGDSDPQATGDGTAAKPSWLARSVTLVRTHWLLSALVAIGLVLRILAVIAYHPALIYVDSLKYLYDAAPGADPLGYKVILKVVLVFGGVGPVAVLQHLVGLAMGILLYAVLRRRGAAWWLAAIAAAPVLLDAYQVQMETMIMPDVWFEAAIVAGLAVLLWRPELTTRAAVLAGLILGISATIRQVGEVLLLPALVYLLLAVGGGWREIGRKAVALIIAFAFPVLAYSTLAYEKFGHFRLGRGQATIGRTTEAADCQTLKISPNARLLCPTPAEQAKGPDWLEHSKYSPLYHTTLPPGVRRGRLLTELNSAVRHQQPARVGLAILRDSVRLFALTRTQVSSVTPISRWQFHEVYPTYPKWITLGPRNTIVVGLQHKAFGPFYFKPLKPSFGGPAQVNHGAASFLRSYQLDGGYTPGPLFLVATVAGVAGALLVVRRRRETPFRGPALACLLFTASAVIILGASDVFEFSWRYQLPAVVTLVPGGALGLTALVLWIRTRRTQRG